MEDEKISKIPPKINPNQTTVPKTKNKQLSKMSGLSKE
jgi:hypothetical protein